MLSYQVDGQQFELYTLILGFWFQEMTLLNCENFFEIPKY